MQRESGPTVFVVDPDESSRSAVRAVAETVGLSCEAFDSAPAFFAAFDPLRPGCLALEVRLPGLSGLQVQQRLVQGAVPAAVIFLAAHADVSLAVRAMRQGALNFLLKPCGEQELCDAIQEAMAVDRKRRAAWLEQMQLEERLGTLNEKERYVLERIAEGKPNKAIASLARVSLRTIEIRRGRLMRKLGVRSPGELLRIALAASDGWVGNGDGSDEASFLPVGAHRKARAGNGIGLGGAHDGAGTQGAGTPGDAGAAGFAWERFVRGERSTQEGRCEASGRHQEF